MYTYIIIHVYYIHMMHNIYTYNILIISYYIHISELQNKFKILNFYIQIIHIFIKFYHVVKHNIYVKILKIQKEFYVQNLLFEF